MPSTELYCHFVWSTYLRLPLLTAQLEPIAYRHLRAKTRSLRATVLAIGGTVDHVHLVVRMPPTLASARFVGQIKAVASRELNRSTPATLRWQAEYGAFSLGRGQLRSTIAYVQNQKHHHAHGQLIDALEPDR